MLGDVLDNFRAVFVVKLLVNCGTLQSSRNIRARINESFVPQLLYFKNLVFSSESFLEPDDNFLLEEIDDADEIIFATERKLQRNRMSTEALANRADDVIK